MWLLYALVVAGLLNVDGELFSNTRETEHFLCSETQHTWVVGCQAYRSL